MQAYSLRSHQAVVPPANRKVQCLGLGLAFSVYGLFPVINLEPEGRVIAGCSGAGRGAGGGDGGSGGGGGGFLHDRPGQVSSGPARRSCASSQGRTVLSLLSALELGLWGWSVDLGCELLSLERICPQCGRPGFDPWIGKIPRRREWLPTQVFLPEEFRRQRSLVGYSVWGRKELDTPSD